MPGVRGAGNVFDGSATAAGVLTVRSYASIRQNRLHLDGAASAKIVQGDYITITRGASVDTYEFRDSTPPAGGTAGRIWVYNGADAAASRANLIKAINATVDVNVVTRTPQDANAGTNLIPLMSLAAATHVIGLYEVTAVGGAVLRLYTTGDPALTATENLTTAADVWDQAAFGPAHDNRDFSLVVITVTITAAMIATGHYTVIVAADSGATILCQQVIAVDRNRVHNEVCTPSGGMVDLVLTGGASPNIQANDVVDFYCFCL